MKVPSPTLPIRERNWRCTKVQSIAISLKSSDGAVSRQVSPIRQSLCRSLSACLPRLCILRKFSAFLPALFLALCISRMVPTGLSAASSPSGLLELVCVPNWRPRFGSCWRSAVQAWLKLPADANCDMSLDGPANWDEKEELPIDGTESDRNDKRVEENACRARSGIATAVDAAGRTG